MKRKNLDPNLLNEEIKKFRLLSEYSFYHEEKTDNDYKKPLILGDLEEADEIPADQPAEDDNNNDKAIDDLSNELGIGGEETPAEDPNAMGGEEMPAEEMPAEEPNAMGDEEMPAEEPNPMGGEEDVEVDVTSLVKNTDDAKEAADNATRNSEMLLKKLDDLEMKISKMDSVANKIENLEQEIIKRNPTPIEKLEMRSLDSFPYNQKLTDFWGERTDNYQAQSDEEESQGYTLTRDDVDVDYSPSEIKNSFSATPDDYEEEDI
jgi:hypothetical protein